MGRKSKGNQVDDGDKRLGQSGLTLAEAREHLADMNVTQDTPFRGYCIHIPASDEFLATLNDTPAATNRGFSQGPSQALRYPSYKAAAKWCRHERGEMIVGLFETPDQYIVTSAEAPDSAR